MSFAFIRVPQTKLESIAQGSSTITFDIDTYNYYVQDTIVTVNNRHCKERNEYINIADVKELFYKGLSIKHCYICGCNCRTKKYNIAHIAEDKYEIVCDSHDIQGIHLNDRYDKTYTENGIALVVLEEIAKFKKVYPIDYETDRLNSIYTPLERLEYELKQSYAKYKVSNKLWSTIYYPRLNKDSLSYRPNKSSWSVSKLLAHIKEYPNEWTSHPRYEVRDVVRNNRILKKIAKRAKLKISISKRLQTVTHLVAHLS